MPAIQLNNIDTSLYRRVLFEQRLDSVKTYDEAQNILRGNPNDSRALQFMGWYTLPAQGYPYSDPESCVSFLEKSLAGGA